MPSTPTPAAPGDVLGAFPASMPGHQRHVVKLPPLENEHLHRVELLGGKTLKVDCNRQSMDGHFSPREVPGRNYPYWVFSSKGQVMSTRLGCPPGSDRQQFVSAETLHVRYNSRIPLGGVRAGGLRVPLAPVRHPRCRSAGAGALTRCFYFDSCLRLSIKRWWPFSSRTRQSMPALTASSSA